MNWTEADLARLEASRSQAAGKPARKKPPKKQPLVLGEWRDFDLFVPWAIPSFKNSKELYVRDGKPGMATKKEYRAVMNAVTNFIGFHWRGPPLSNVSYRFVFFTRQLEQDDDGSESTVLDCLRDARVIQDDNRRHIRECLGHTFTLVTDPAQEGVRIVLRGQSC